MNKILQPFSLAILIALCGCESSTLIQSTPEGANVYVDGKNVGMTPYLYTDDKIIFSKTPLRLEYEGYQTVDYVLCRNEQPEVGPIVGAFFTSGITLLWGLGYNPEQNFEMIPDSAIYEPGPVRPSPDLNAMASELKIIKDLKDQGILTDEEYQAQKKKILEKYNRE